MDGACAITRCASSPFMPAVVLFWDSAASECAGRLMYSSKVCIQRRARVERGACRKMAIDCERQMA